MSKAAYAREAKRSAKGTAAPTRARLHVNEPGDEYEREADWAAAQVLSGPTQPIAWSLSSLLDQVRVQRECSCGGTCEDCNEKEKILQRKPTTTSHAAESGYALSSVESVLSRPGNSLDESTRALMESRFGYDFSRVRIHHDEQAAASARDVSAHAYTVGSSIVFDRGKYEPHSEAGGRLLAHELAHVVQQQSGETRGIQRHPDDTDTPEGRKAAADIDETFATLYSTFYSGVESDSPEVLIAYGENLAPKYETAQAKRDSPLSQLALATILSRIYSTLKSDESTAERDNDGALLTSSFEGLVPWTKSRPHSVSDIPTFTPERILAWQADADANEREQSLRKDKPARKPSAHTPPPGFVQLVPAAASATSTPAKPAATTSAKQDQRAQAQTPPVEAQPKTQDEKDNAADSGSGPVVQKGLTALKGAKLSSLNQADAEKRVGDTKAAKPESQKGDMSLLDACAQIWFLSNRMYLLDRTGHLAPREDAWFDVASVSGLQPGGIYFIKPGNERIYGTTINFRYYVITGTGAETAGVSINFPRVLTALIPVLELSEELAKRQVGAGLIIAPTFAQKRLTVSDISGKKLLAALAKVPGNLPWAINAECNRIKENPLGEAANQALAFGLDYVSKFIPVVGQAAMLYQLIELFAWLGEVGNVAAYAQTEDEIDIAAQAIARKLAQFLVFEFIHSRIKGGLHPEGLPGAKERGAHPEPKGGAKETPEAVTGKTENAPVHENMEPAGKSSPAAVYKEGKLASQDVALPGSGEHHEVIGTKEGFGRCSESPCPAIPIVYADELGKVPEFKSRYDAIRKLGETDVNEATKQAADLVREIESYRLAEGKSGGAAQVTPPPSKGAGSVTGVQTPSAGGGAEKVLGPTDTGGGAVDKPAAKPEAKPVEKPVEVIPPEQKPAAQAKDAPATGTPAAPASSKPAPRAIDDVLSTDRMEIAAKEPAVRARFTPDQLVALDRLQAAYQSYKKGAGASPQKPEGWLRSVTRGEPREDAETLFGEAYALGNAGSSVPVPPIRLKEIPRPADYSEPRLQVDLATLQKDASLWDRLIAVKQKGILNGEVPNAILNILKGNIGEILAKPTIESRLAAVRQTPAGAGARMEFKTYISQRRADGSYEAPKLFSDGLIVSEKGHELQISDAFEIKAGKQGGAEATSQFFEWREGRLNSGDQLILSDGRKFVYAPGKTGPPGAGVAGYARGMMTSQGNIVAARGAEHLGGGSSEQIGAAGTRTALPQTASEIEYLARVLLESLPQVSSPPATGTPAPTSTATLP
jgi:Domain of unknown function (DUF4157)/Putative RNase-like toxin, toxin_1